MESLASISKNLYQRNAALVFTGLFVSTLIVEMMSSTTYLLLLMRPRALIIGMLLAFTGLNVVAQLFTDWFLEKYQLDTPMVQLWFYPLVTLFFSYIFVITFLAGTPAVFGRGFWSEIVGVNAKTTTILFTTTIVAFKIYMAFSFFLALIWYLRAWIRLSQGREAQWHSSENSLLSTGVQGETQIPQEKGQLEGLPPSKIPANPGDFPTPRQPAGPPGTGTSLADRPFPAVSGSEPEEAVKRVRGKQFNRLFFFLTCGLLILTGCWVVFGRPETILNYRAEIQLMSTQHPEVAFEAFQQIIRKYPDYRYLDTVEFRSAWTLDRRMEKFPEAVKAYEEILKKYGFQNVWADEVLANLVRLHLDKLKNPEESLKSAELYLRHFPNGQMVAHITIYRIRALLALGKHQEAKAAAAKAKTQFAGVDLILYDNDDDFASALPFETALATIDL